ncbi:MAG: hypothetical protein FJ288_02970 [Planctomycetes bacterium]|nr:hypothetical protein [Planctomycetota bacterium]
MRRVLARLAAVGVIGILAAFEVSAPAAERPGGAAAPGVARPDAAAATAGDVRASRMKMLQPGQPAPDVELPRLVVEKGQDGQSLGKLSREKVKLSSFAGRKPVCLIFTSYT